MLRDDNELAKSRKFNTLKTSVNQVNKKIPNATALFYINLHATQINKS